MTLNELCTNTTKFGALSIPSGRVAISWVVDENKRVQFTWREHGGPTVQAPTRQSFGTRLIETLGKQLRGSVKLAYEPSGLVYVLDVPLASLEFSTIE
jgi:two-component sensor histidine kinase